MSNFKEYTTSAAFRLDLSRNMIEALLTTQMYGLPSCTHWFTAGKALERRGLIRKGEGWHLTEEGEIVCRLVRLAGFETPKNEFKGVV